MNFWCSRIASLWAGLCIGGNLIAASAKFQVASLPLSTALEIGQVTFRAVGVLEAFLCVGLTVSLLSKGQKFRNLWVAPIFIFAIQWLAIMPFLHARTVAVVTGTPVPSSNLHLIYVVLEVIKVCALIGAGFTQKKDVG